MTTLAITLEQAVKELTAYNMLHPADLLALLQKLAASGKSGPDVLDSEYSRMVLHEGQVYKVCLTRMFMAKTWLWMLSVMKPYGEENQGGARLPTESEATEIAKAFFPKGCTALNDSDQILTIKSSLKFISTDLEVANE